MWINSKYGLFNTDTACSIEYKSDGTYISYADKYTWRRISDDPVVADILTALERHEEFLTLE